MSNFSFVAKCRQWFATKSGSFPLTCPSGEKQFCLVGSIHMGVSAMSPLPNRLRKALTECDALIVEADITDPFIGSEIEPITPSSSLQSQLTSEQWQTFIAICQECQLNATALAEFPAWQIGLTLQQKQAIQLGLQPEFGIDYQLLTLAHQARQAVIALESQQQQLDLLTTLPDQGLSLLIDSLSHWRSNARQLQTMIDWWLVKSHHAHTALPELTRSFGSDLQKTFIDQRNQQWAKQLLSLPRGRYLVAVGALHLCGPNNLIDLLTTSSVRES